MPISRLSSTAHSPRAGPADAHAANAVVASLLDEARDWFELEQVAPSDRSCTEVALMRYEGQGGELAITWTGDATDADAAFAESHRALYGFAMEAPIELVTVRVEATGRMPTPTRRSLEPVPMPLAEETRPVHFVSGTRVTPVYAREALGRDCVFSGPSVVTQLDATTLIPPGWNALIHASGAMILRRLVGGAADA